MGVMITRRGGGSGGGGELAYCTFENEASYGVNTITIPELIGKKSFVIVADTVISGAGAVVVTLFPDGMSRVTYRNSGGSLYYTTRNSANTASDGFFDPTTGTVKMSGFGTGDSTKFAAYGNYRVHYAE